MSESQLIDEMKTTLNLLVADPCQLYAVHLRELCGSMIYLLNEKDTLANGN